MTASHKKKHTTTKNQLVEAISNDHNVNPKDALKVIQAFLNSIIESLARGDRLEFRDFGIFEIVQRKQKIGRNPKNAAIPIVIPPHMAVKFTAGKKMDLLLKNVPIRISE